MNEQPTPQQSGPNNSQNLQVLGSIALALLIVIGVVAAVTGRLGPTSIAELRAEEEAREDAEEEAEEQAEEAEEAAEEPSDLRADRGRERNRVDRSGRGRSGRGGSDRDRRDDHD